MTEGLRLLFVCRKLSCRLQSQLLVERTHHEVCRALLAQAGPDVARATEFGRAYLNGEARLASLVSSLSPLIGGASSE